MSRYAKIFDALLTSQRANGVTLSGGKVYFYSPGSLIKKNIYTSRAKSTIADNPYTLDTNGQAIVYGDGLYDVRVKNSTESVSLPLWENVKIKDYDGEVTYSVSDYADLEAAVAAIGSTKATLEVSTNQTVSNNLTIPSTLEIKPLNGAIITIDLDITITFNGSLTAPDNVQVFTGSGSVTGLRYTTTSWFGAAANGVTDDTAAVNRALSAAKYIDIVPGVHMINAITKLMAKTGTTINFLPGAELHAITNNSASYRVIDTWDQNNITIINPVIVGDRATHSGVGGEQGHGIAISASQNIRIINPYISNCWGDGIYVGDVENGYIEGGVLDNNRRQGISVADAINLTITGTRISNTNGTAPQSGIDLEPDLSTQDLKGVRLINIITENNTGEGITINLTNLIDSTHEIDIIIDNHQDFGSYDSIAISNVNAGTGSLTGQILIKNSFSKLADGNGIYIVNYGAVKTPVLNIINPIVINPNTAGDSSTSPKYGSGIAFVREAAETITAIMGNCNIIGATIIDDRATVKARGGIYFTDEKGTGFQAFQILDPLRIDTITNSLDVAANELKITGVSSGVKIRDQYSVVTLNRDSGSFTLYGQNGVGMVTTDGSSGAVTIILDQSTNNDRVTKFVNTGNGTLTLVPTGTTSVGLVPYSTVAGKYMSTAVPNASIILRRLPDGNYLVENLIGTWTVEP